MTGRRPTNFSYVTTEDGRPMITLGRPGQRHQIRQCRSCLVFCSVCSQNGKCCLQDPLSAE